MNLNDYINKYISLQTNNFKLNNFLDEIKKLHTKLIVWKTYIDIIKQKTKKNLSFLISKKLITPEKFEGYMTILKYFQKRVETESTHKSLKKDFLNLTDFFPLKKDKLKEYENKKKYITYCSKGQDGILPDCGKAVNLPEANIEKIISEYDNFISSDKEFQKKFKFNKKTKKIEYSSKLINDFIKFIHIYTFNFKSSWNGFEKYIKTEITDDSDQTTILNEMVDIKELKEKYNIDIFFLLQTYNNLYPGCLRKAKK